MFVEFTAVGWDTYNYFGAWEWQTYISTDLISRIEKSELQRWLEDHTDKPPEHYPEHDKRHLYVGRQFTDIIFFALHQGAPDRITVEGAVEDVLIRVELRS